MEFIQKTATLRMAKSRSPFGATIAPPKLGRPPLRGWLFSRPVRVSLGTEKGIEVVPRDWKLIVSIALAVCAIRSMIPLGARANLLGEISATGANRPYSLGKVQWAWWLILILYAYLAIGLMTWNYYNIFSPTALALLGISAILRLRENLLSISNRVFS
jgi:hypothetical protein